MPRAFSKVVAGVGSFGFACILLVFLNLLTYLGTLEQIRYGLFDTQKKYFESILLIHWIGPMHLPDWVGGNERALSIPVPLPGVYLLLALLLVNLVVGGIVRLRKSWSRLGILIAHLGIVLMLVAGFVKYRFATDGRIALYPGEVSSEFESYTDWEITAHEAVPSGTVTEYVIPASAWRSHVEDGPATFQSAALPFDLTITRSFNDCMSYPKGPMFDLDPRIDSELVDGWFLRKGHEPEKGDARWDEHDNPAAEARLPGVVLTLRDKTTAATTNALLWGMPRLAGQKRMPLTYAAGGREWLLELRQKRWQLPFAVQVDEFHFEQHPRTDTPKVYASDVTKIEDGVKQRVKISMNEPLRRHGYTVYQASFGPPGSQPGDRMYTVLAVSNNPSDQWPKYSCFVIAIGLLYHFVLKLTRYVKSENRRRSPAVVHPLPPEASASEPRPRALNSAIRRAP